MELNLNTWLAGLSVDVGGTEMMVYYLVSATDLAQAEAGVLEMGAPGGHRCNARMTGIGGNMQQAWSGSTASFCSMTWKTAFCAG